MSTEPTAAPRRLAVVDAGYRAAGAPPGVAEAAFAAACLADSYELLADLSGVSSGIAGSGPEIEDLLWPGAVRLDGVGSLPELVAQVAGRFDELVCVPADVPDLPGLVIAKVFKALQHADICVAPERGGGGGCAAVGVRVPLRSWISVALDLDSDPLTALQTLAPQRRRVAVGPDWHRMRTPTAIQRLDPGLEGWEMTRSLLSGKRLRVE